MRDLNEHGKVTKTKIARNSIRIKFFIEIRKKIKTLTFSDIQA